MVVGLLRSNGFGLDTRVCPEKGAAHRMVRKVILVAVLLGVLTVLAGCSTVEGMGRDITWLGEKGAEVFE